MQDRSRVTVALLAAVVVLLSLLLVLRSTPSVHAQSQTTEGRADSIIAVASPVGGDGVLYVLDANREVILVYALHQPGAAPTHDLRSAAFEFIAGRLYRWDALVATKEEYSLKGVKSLRGLRVFGPGGSEEEYKRLQH